MKGESLLTTQNLSVTFRRMERLGRVDRIPALKGVSLSLSRGEVLAVIGSCGSGKSILAHAILGILPANAETHGQILYRGEGLTCERLKQLRGREIALIPQSVSYLDPLVKAKHAVRWAARMRGLSETEARVAQQDACFAVGLSEEAGERFPFQLSGGMLRRVFLAIATVGNPTILVVDEPTPGLHPEAVAESLQRLRGFADDGKTVLLISHDIAASLTVADRVAVFLDGSLVEVARADAFQGQGERLQHPYSRMLWNALPQNAFAGTSDFPTPPVETLHVASD